MEPALKHSRESVLFAVFLLLLAGVLLFNLFTSPAMYRAKFTALEETTTQVVPAISETASVSEESSFENAGAETAVDHSGKVNINTADEDELMTLKGIGEVRARNIVEDRKKNGRFTSPRDLLRVNGIGEKTLEKILPQITV